MCGPRCKCTNSVEATFTGTMRHVLGKRHREKMGVEAAGGEADDAADDAAGTPLAVGSSSKGLGSRRTERTTQHKMAKAKKAAKAKTNKIIEQVAAAVAADKAPAGNGSPAPTVDMAEMIARAAQH